MVTYEYLFIWDTTELHLLKVFAIFLVYLSRKVFNLSSCCIGPSSTKCLPFIRNLLMNIYGRTATWYPSQVRRRIKVKIPNPRATCLYRKFRLGKEETIL